VKCRVGSGPGGSWAHCKRITARAFMARAAVARLADS
jgi:hypothetical protein